MYLYKRKKAGNRGEGQSIRKRKSKTFIPDFTGIQLIEMHITLPGYFLQLYQSVLKLLSFLIGDDDANERYVLDPVGSEKGKPIIKGGVHGDTKDSTEVNLKPIG